MRTEEICEDCLVKACCSEVCEKLIKSSRKIWDSIKETGKCPKCGHHQGVIYEALGRTPAFSIYCQKCKQGFGFDFSEILMETYLFNGNEELYEGLNIPKYKQSFNEIVGNIARLGIT